MKFLHLTNHNDDLKGTEAVEAAFARIDGLWRYNGVFFIEKQLSHHQALSAIKQCDVLIENLVRGYYGLTAVEAMAMGKAVICKIQQPPFLYAETGTIEDVIRFSILHPFNIKAAAKQGPTYINKYHNAEKIANRMLRDYQEGLNDQRQPQTAY